MLELMTSMSEVRGQSKVRAFPPIVLFLLLLIFIFCSKSSCPLLTISSAAFRHYLVGLYFLWLVLVEEILAFPFWPQLLIFFFIYCFFFFLNVCLTLKGKKWQYFLCFTPSTGDGPSLSLVLLVLYLLKGASPSISSLMVGVLSLL